MPQEFNAKTQIRTNYGKTLRVGRQDAEIGISAFSFHPSAFSFAPWRLRAFALKWTGKNDPWPSRRRTYLPPGQIALWLFRLYLLRSFRFAGACNNIAK
jgi:hypothetical protein